MSSRFEHHAGSGSEAASAALKEIGHLLRETRQARDEDLYDVADYLRIKPSYLFALEDGDLALTPGRVYALGFLRSYGEHLGFNGEELVGYAKQAMAGTAARPALNYRAPVPESRRPGGILIAASILTVGLVYGGWRMVDQDQPVLDRVAAVPGDVGRLASQVLALGSGSPAFAPPGDDGPTAAATGADASTVATTGEATAALPAAPTTLAPAAPDPESAVAATPPAMAALPMTPSGPPRATGPATAATPAGRAAASPVGPLGPVGAGDARAAMASTVRGPLTAQPDDVRTAPVAVPQAGMATASAAAPSMAAAASAPATGGPVESAPAESGDARALLASLDSGTAAEQGMTAPTGAGMPVGAGGENQVVLLANQESWVQIRSRDRQYVRTWTLQAGERYAVPERGDLALWTGNAGGIDVLVDGRNLGALGADGHVIRDVALTADALKARLAASR